MNYVELLFTLARFEQISEEAIEIHKDPKLYLKKTKISRLKEIDDELEVLASAIQKYKNDLL